MACCACTVKQKKIWLWTSSALALLFALIFGLLWPSLFSRILHTQLELREGSLTYDNWVETPLPMFAEFYMFHWENPEEVYDKQKKPRFIEKGPYVFQEVHTRNNVQFFDNATVAFNQTRKWHFRPDRSNGSLDDQITNLNTIAMTIGYSLRNNNALMKVIGETLLKWGKAHLTVTHSVRDLIFEGYDDPILDFVRRMNLKQFVIPFQKFGWFVERNGSSAYDGRFHMHTGVDDIKSLGELLLWNEQSRTSAFPGDCGAIHGTTGELWPPGEEKTRPLTMFIGDVCRTIQLKYDGEASKFDMTAQLYVADESVLDNGVKYPENACYCTAQAASCPDLAPGALNISQCKFGAPAFLSFPHFYLGDESYRERVEGMVPDANKHQFYMLMERSLGIPMEVRAGMQINLLMDAYFDKGLFQGLPRIMIPMFWFRQSADITDYLARSAYWASKASDIGFYFIYTIAGLAVIVLLVGVYLTIAKKWGRRDDEDDPLFDDGEPRE